MDDSRPAHCHALPRGYALCLLSMLTFTATHPVVLLACPLPPSKHLHHPPPNTSLTTGPEAHGGGAAESRVEWTCCWAGLGWSGQQRRISAWRQHAQPQPAGSRRVGGRVVTCLSDVGLVFLHDYSQASCCRHCSGLRSAWAAVCCVYISNELKAMCVRPVD